MDTEVLARLLRLYPVDALREFWEVSGKPSKDEFVEIVAKNIAEDEIAEFCRTHHGRTKQRVILFRNKAEDVAGFGDPLLSGQAPVFVQRSQNSIEEFYLIEFAYRAIVGGPPWNETTINFAWPIRVTVDLEYVRVTFTIVEKNVSTYLDGDLRAVGVKKDVDEEAVVGMLFGALESPDTIERLDMNKGVKALWEGGEFDAEVSKFKASKSTRTETMDTKCLLRRDSPEEYANAMEAPLLRTVFETLKAELNYPPLFSADPSAGELVVTRYSEDGDEVDNVVRAILSAN